MGQDAGFTLTVFDINPKVQQTFLDHHGGNGASSLGQLGSSSDVVITMLPDGQVVRRVTLGDGEDSRDQLLGSMPMRRCACFRWRAKGGLPVATPRWWSVAAPCLKPCGRSPAHRTEKKNPGTLGGSPGRVIRSDVVRWFEEMAKTQLR